MWLKAEPLRGGSCCWVEGVGKLLCECYWVLASRVNLLTEAQRYCIFLYDPSARLFVDPFVPDDLYSGHIVLNVKCSIVFGEVDELDGGYELIC